MYLVTGTGPGMYTYNVLSMAATFFAFMLFFNFIDQIRSLHRDCLEGGSYQIFNSMGPPLS